jgi:Repeat of unknown function (DUF5648)
MPTIPFPRQKTVNSGMGNAPASQTPRRHPGIAPQRHGGQYTGNETTSTALLRVYSPASGDHFYTISVAERDNAVAKLGYVDEGVACHMFATAGTSTTPLLRV